MKLIDCPMNGLKPENEFSYGGEIQTMPVPTDDNQAWTEYLFFSDNLPGEIWEWWCHTPSGYWFVASRNTMTDTFLETLSIADARKRLGAAI